MEQTQTRTEEKLIDIIGGLLKPQGYDVIAVEIQPHGPKLCVFIDRLEPGQTIGIEDCVKATKAIDEPLDQNPEISALFPKSYELEISSPGVDRPLTRLKHFERFKGEQARIHTYRPLSAEELGNADYQSKNPKQKNFLGTISGIKTESVLLQVAVKSDKSEELSIPLTLITKAHLEPKLNVAELTKRRNA